MSPEAAVSTIGRLARVMRRPRGSHAPTAAIENHFVRDVPSINDRCLLVERDYAEIDRPILRENSISRFVVLSFTTIETLAGSLRNYQLGSLIVSGTIDPSEFYIRVHTCDKNLLKL